MWNKPMMFKLLNLNIFTHEYSVDNKLAATGSSDLSNLLFSWGGGGRIMKSAYGWAFVPHICVSESGEHWFR